MTQAQPKLPVRVCPLLTGHAELLTDPQVSGAVRALVPATVLHARASVNKTYS
jgi:hypothetical protein